MARAFLVACLLPSLSAGCLPFVTKGRRYMGGWDTSGVGVTVPIALKSSSASSDPAESGGLKESLFLELSGFQQGGLPLWFWDSDSDPDWGEEHSCFDFREISVGIGKGWRPRWGDDLNWLGRSTRQLWWGGAVGLSFLHASLENPSGLNYDDSTVGAYASAGFYNPCFGGLLLRYTFAPDVEMHGTDWGMSGLTVSYWWGWAGTAGVGAANAAPIIAVGILVGYGVYMVWTHIME